MKNKTSVWMACIAMLASATLLAPAASANTLSQDLKQFVETNDPRADQLFTVGNGAEVIAVGAVTTSGVCDSSAQFLTQLIADCINYIVDKIPTLDPQGIVDYLLYLLVDYMQGAVLAGYVGPYAVQLAGYTVPLGSYLAQKGDFATDSVFCTAFGVSCGTSPGAPLPPSPPTPSLPPPTPDGPPN